MYIVDDINGIMASIRRDLAKEGGLRQNIFDVVRKTASIL